MKYGFNLLVLIFCFATVFAQDSGHNSADQKFKESRYQEAYQSYQLLSDQYFESRQFNYYADCHFMMVRCLLKTGDLRGALSLAQETKSFVDNNELSQDYLGQSLMLIGESKLNLGLNKESIENFTKALKLLPSNSLDAAECYENLGIAYWNNGNLEVAQGYHEKSLLIRQNNNEEGNYVLQGDSYLNIGLLLLETEPTRSVEYFEKALAIYKETLDSSDPKKAYLYTNLAFASAGMSNYQQAITYMDLVDQIWRQQYQGDHPNVAFAKSNRARLLVKLGEHDQALILLQEALTIYHSLYGEKHPEISNVYYQIAEIYFNRGDFLSSIENYHSAIYSNLIGQSSSNIYDLPKLENYFNPDILLYSLHAKAGALEAYHFNKSLKKRDIESALEVYALCDELITDLRGIRESEQDKLKLSKESYEIYLSAMESALYLSKYSVFPKPYLEKVFEFAERSKAGVLQEAIQESNAKEFGRIPKSKIDFEDSLKKEIAYKELLIAHENDLDRLKKLETDLFEYQSALRLFAKELESDYPEYFQLKYDHAPLKISQLQSNISDDQAVVSYFTGEDRFFVMSLTSKSIDVVESKLDKGFSKKIKALRNTIRYQDNGSFDKISKELYNLLIPSLPKQVKNVVLIPDGVLGTIPFEVLKNKDGQYLIEEYSLSYEYSAKMLYQKMVKKDPVLAKSALLLAPIDFDKNDIRLSSLKASQEEIREIKYLFGGDGYQCKVGIGSQATESVLKSKDLNSYSCIHLATHGIVNSEVPELSRVFLTPADEEDGNLYEGEIYSLNMNADLVTLSACETGLGKVVKGEGVVGLSRALMYAGANNIVVSLWTVSDQSTSKLMINFYKNHLYHSTSKGYSRDLRSAKLAMINSEEFSDPYYWAAFILIGQ
ncbi:CHAT domain-containing protein [Reichenbachiella versicolor]|uniref:CHAT domain-containing protein n=1 Tax=Reichenbachiella versicolor TaxID=1821036 RepID=UPI000D6E3785|nr:CHAT domain-containing protein [Reichenbachiella versicolor]